MRRLNVLTAVFLASAALCGLMQFVSAFFVHVAVRGHQTSAGWVVPPTKTSMQAYPVSEVTLALAIIALVALVGIVLSRRASRELRGAGGAAWSVSIVTTALGASGLVHLFGVGVCLLLACASVPRHRGEATRGGPPVPTAAGVG
jgi:hypothetical protein